MSELNAGGAGAGGRNGGSSIACATAAVDKVHDETASPSSSKGSSSLTAASQPSLTLTALRQHTASHVGKPLVLAEKMRGMATNEGEGEDSPPEAGDSRRRRSSSSKVRKVLSDTEFLGKVMYAVTDQLTTRKTMIRHVRKLIQDKAYRHWCVARCCCSVAFCLPGRPRLYGLNTHAQTYAEPFTHARPLPCPTNTSKTILHAHMHGSLGSVAKVLVNAADADTGGADKRRIAILYVVTDIFLKTKNHSSHPDFRECLDPIVPQLLDLFPVSSNLTKLEHWKPVP